MQLATLALRIRSPNYLYSIRSALFRCVIAAGPGRGAAGAQLPSFRMEYRALRVPPYYFLHQDLGGLVP